MRLLPILSAAVLGPAVYLAFSTPAPPWVVLITIDTLRADRIGAYGHPSNRTPALDALAKEGWLFEDAYCDMPWTTGSMASVMTGHYGSRHGVQLPNHKLKSEAVTLAEILRHRGYYTAAVIGSFPLDSVYGLDQGFDVYDDEFTRAMVEVPGAPIYRVESRLPDDLEEQSLFIAEKFKNNAYRSDDEVTDAAIRRLDTLDLKRPAFLWVHYFGPHEKLLGDRSFVYQEPDIIAAYDGDVEISDRAVGRLIDHLRRKALLDRSLVVVHADHGQNLGEHDYVGHGLSLDEAAVHIPLIIRGPGLSPGVRRLDVARNVDILPTVLDVVGLSSRATVQGRSLLDVPDRSRADRPSVSGDADGERSFIDEPVAFFETHLATIVIWPLETPDHGTVLGPVKKQGLRSLGWKLVTADVVGPCTRGTAPTRDGWGAWSFPQPVTVDQPTCEAIHISELYKASDPPDGGTNVAATHAGIASELAVVLGAYAEQTVALRDDLRLSSEQERKLKSLGYLQ